MNKIELRKLLGQRSTKDHFYVTGSMFDIIYCFVAISKKLLLFLNRTLLVDYVYQLKRYILLCFSSINSPVLSLSCIFCSISWAEARLVCSDVHSSSISLKLTDSPDESVTAAAATAPAAELWDDCLFGMIVWEFSEWGFVLEKNLR